MDWRDYTSLGAVVFVLVVIIAISAGLPIAQLGDWRAATALLAVLGLLVFFMISPLITLTSRPEPIITVALGILALLLTIAGVVVSSQAIFLSLCVNLALLWSLATYYHVQAGKRSRVHH